MEQRKVRGKAVKKQKLSAKSGRGGNPDKNSSIIKIFIVYEFLPSTRFLCEKAEQREKSKKTETFRKKAEEVATLVYADYFSYSISNTLHTYLLNFDLIN